MIGNTQHDIYPLIVKLFRPCILILTMCHVESSCFLNYFYMLINCFVKKVNKIPLFYKRAMTTSTLSLYNIIVIILEFIN